LRPWRLIDRLEARGLLKRCSDPQDRRIWRLRLPPAGAEIAARRDELVQQLAPTGYRKIGLRQRDFRQHAIVRHRIIHRGRAARPRPEDHQWLAKGLQARFEQSFGSEGMLLLTNL
jgi:DNA-binding MarR family transcriptional regulator